MYSWTLQLLPGMWKCLGVRERVGVAGREERGELRPLDGSVPPNKKKRISGRNKKEIKKQNERVKEGKEERIMPEYIFTDGKMSEQKREVRVGRIGPCTRETGMIERKKTACGRFTIMNKGTLDIRVKRSTFKSKVQSLVSKTFLCVWWYYDNSQWRVSFACDENKQIKHATYTHSIIPNPSELPTYSTFKAI